MLLRMQNNRQPARSDDRWRYAYLSGKPLFRMRLPFSRAVELHSDTQLARSRLAVLDPKC
jgi:hypothetical protein